MKFRTKKRVNFFDCDPAGIMFFGNAFKLIHSAYEEMISAFEFNDYWTSEDFFVPIIKTSFEFLKPVRAGENVIIEVSLVQLREHSFELGYSGSDEKGNQFFTSKTVHVFTDHDFNKIGIPKNILNKFKEFSGYV